MVISVGTVSSTHALSNSHAHHLVVDLPTCCFLALISSMSVGYITGR